VVNRADLWFVCSGFGRVLFGKKQMVIESSLGKLWNIGM
jgi:hypothetical protein